VLVATSSGVFDTPTGKCPPDRGSSDWVTASPAPYRPQHHPLSASPLSSRASSASDSSDSFDQLLPNIVYPPTPPLDASDVHSKRIGYPAPPISAYVAGGTSPIYGGGGGGASLPQAIPKATVRPGTSFPGLETPPHSPEDRTSSGGPNAGADDALALLSALFPRDAARALSHARKVSIDAPQLGAAFSGVVLALPGRARTLYVDGKAAAEVNLRESIVALLDLADERLDCEALVIALERSAPQLGELLHSLMYVGGQVVTKPPFEVNPAFVLVGMEL
jgi:hypothetical protein